MKEAERLDAGIERRGPDDCWPWTRATRKGYGTIKVSAGQLGFTRTTDVFTHRLVFRLTHGRWPEPVARHTCDNPLCCNPAHIIEGTWKQNMEDKYERGRDNHPKGGDSARSALTDAQAGQIREVYARGGVSQRELARQFGVSQPSVSRIVSGRRYVA